MRSRRSSHPHRSVASLITSLLLSAAFAPSFSGCGMAMSQGPGPAPAHEQAKPHSDNRAAVAGSASPAGGLERAPGPGPELSPQLGPFAYFVGAWTCTIVDSPLGSFRWKLEPVLGGRWLAGQVELQGPITRDLWGYDAGRGQLIRLAYDVEGMLVQLTTPGWQGDTLIFSGSMSQDGTLMTVREVVQRAGDTEFSARWESLGQGGTWKLMADERCVRNP